MSDRILNLPRRVENEDLSTAAGLIVDCVQQTVRVGGQRWSDGRDREGVQELAGRSESLDASGPVSDEDLAISSNGQLPRLAKFTIAESTATEGEQKHAVRIEDLHTIVVAIGGIDSPARISCEIGRG